MIAVAAIAGVIVVATQAVRLRQLSRYYREKAVHAAQMEQAITEPYRRLKAKMDQQTTTVGEPASASPKDRQASAEVNVREAWLRGVAGRIEKNAHHYRMLKEKYEHAARYPWLPLDPDPPVPEQ